MSYTWKIPGEIRDVPERDEFYRKGYADGHRAALYGIVRCQVCIYKTRSEICPNALDCKRTGLPTDDDFYCAWGIREDV